MKADVAIVVEALLAAGFVEDDSSYEPDPAMSENGPYAVLARLRRGEVAVLIEQNSVNEDHGGLSALVTYPPVAVLERGDARVACDGEDAELIVAVAGDLDG